MRDTMTRDEKTRTLRAQIQTLHDAGVSALDMCKVMNLSRDVIYYHRKQMGLNQSVVRPEVTADMRQQIKALANNRLSYKKIAAQFGLAQNTVKTIVHDSDSIANRDIGDVLVDPVNRLLARRWA